MNSWSQQSQQTTDYNYTQYSQSTYYDSASGQYYDPTTGQYYDYSAYYAQQQAASGTVTQSEYSLTVFVVTYLEHFTHKKMATPVIF